MHTTTENPTLLTRWDAVMMNNYGTPALGIVHGHGCYLTDEQGKNYLDMLSGIAVSSLGYGHPALVKAVSDQAESFAHVSNLFAHEPGIAVAEKLAQRFAPGRDDVRVMFCNSGAEANEAAFKLARLTGRGRILAAENGFHGRTMGSLAMTGQPGKREPFAPLPGGVEFYPYGDTKALTELVEQDPDNVAAIILEPIQGETGVIPAPEGFLSEVRSLCDRVGALMIVDEVQTGVGRTGDFYAHAHGDGVLPDVVTMAKGLGAGLPIGAVVACGRAASLFTPGSHGTTFGGNPIATAAAAVVLDIVDDDFIAAVADKGAHLTKLITDIEGVDHVRGRGLMLGVVLKEPIAKDVVARGLRNGIILNAPAENVIRLTPPLVISAAELELAAEKLATAIAEAHSESPAT
ncbi:acetylornithine transaminase [Corynebacterium aquilae]|uniref:Acetylornithine aminotransferase n=1 Tax=Corynebacterium aquilae DSM 44791 TaxID=1431546 RepID=A0A1L7CFP0_9CORY|nr:acetylornithine transaminase [Corynebacterium aquilae]APT84681.1 acetylornithine aminotransferase [Corynebacterium aquilae DSM 44791]